MAMRERVQTALTDSRDRTNAIPGDERRWDVADVMQVLEDCDVFLAEGHLAVARAYKAGVEAHLREHHPDCDWLPENIAREALEG